MLLAGEDWRQFFDAMEHDAFRLETLPVYVVPQEFAAIERFLAGEGLRPDDTAAWERRLRDYRATGRSVARVHVLTRPLTDYLRFEFAHYERNVAAGEDVRILDVTEAEDVELPDQDFWLFDDQRVVLMHYAADGTQVSRELFDGDPTPFVQWKHRALELALPFTEYVKVIA